MADVAINQPDHYWPDHEDPLLAFCARIMPVQLDSSRALVDVLFEDLCQDTPGKRYAHWDALLEHARHVAAPLMRLALETHGVSDGQALRLGESLATGARLIVYWQNVRDDIAKRNRIRLPEDVAGQHGLSLGLLEAAVQADVAAGDDCGCVDVPTVGISALLPACRATVRDLVGRTRPMLAEGRRLWPMLQGELWREVKRLTLNGEAILRAIQRRGYDTITARPTPGAIDRTRARLACVMSSAPRRARR